MSSSPQPLDGADAQALPVLHADDHLLVIDKPAGLLVHRSALDAHEHDTVLRRLRRQTGQQWLPVHRLDKGTSGVLVLARDADAARALGAAFESGQVAKRYLALVRGWPPEAGRVDHPLSHDPERPSAGQPHREALTHFRRLVCFEWPFRVGSGHERTRYALVEAMPETGRRHQIRRHFKHIGHPLVGDSTHGKGAHNRAVADWLGVARLWLHAQALTLPHPHDGRPLTLQAPPGPEWQALQALQAQPGGASPDNRTPKP